MTSTTHSFVVQWKLSTQTYFKCVSYSRKLYRRFSLNHIEFLELGEEHVCPFRRQAFIELVFGLFGGKVIKWFELIGEDADLLCESGLRADTDELLSREKLIALKYVELTVLDLYALLGLNL